MTVFFAVHPSCIVQETPRAIRVHTTIGGIEVDQWLPKSQIYAHKYTGDHGGEGFEVVEIEMPEWLAKAKGLRVQCEDVHPEIKYPASLDYELLYK